MIFLNNKIIIFRSGVSIEMQDNAAGPKSLEDSRAECDKRIDGKEVNVFLMK